MGIEDQNGLKLIQRAYQLTGGLELGGPFQAQSDQALAITCTRLLLDSNTDPFLRLLEEGEDIGVIP